MSKALNKIGHLVSNKIIPLITTPSPQEDGPNVFWAFAVL